MKIGIDLDGVVFDSENDFRVFSELYDLIELKQNSKKNNKEIMFQDRFAWTENQVNDFWLKYSNKVWNESNYKPGAITVLKMLKDEGHELIVITARGGRDKKVIDITKNRLEFDGMNIFDKYYWATENKAEVCALEKIDLMIDDYYKNCIKIAKRKIKTVYFKDALSKKLRENNYLKVLYNWGEIYRYIKEQT